MGLKHLGEASNPLTEYRDSRIEEELVYPAVGGDFRVREVFLHLQSGIRLYAYAGNNAGWSGSCATSRTDDEWTRGQFPLVIYHGATLRIAIP